MNGPFHTPEELEAWVQETADNIGLIDPAGRPLPDPIPAEWQALATLDDAGLRAAQVRADDAVEGTCELYLRAPLYHDAAELTAYLAAIDEARYIDGLVAAREAQP